MLPPGVPFVAGFGLTVAALTIHPPAPGQSREPYRWQNVEIIGGGFITGIIIHPAERGLMYARTDVGGAYRWEAQAQRWTPITDWINADDWQFTGIESIAVDPADPGRVYLAAGIYNKPRMDKGGVFVSRDRGETWDRSDLALGMGGNESGRGGGERLAVDPNAGHIVYFGSRSDGLWRSTDHGLHWSQVASFPIITTALPNPHPERWSDLTQEVGIVWVKFIPGEETEGQPTQRILAAVSVNDQPLYESTDAGETWRVLPGQPTGLRPIRAALASNGNLFITYCQNPGPAEITDGAVYRYDTRSDTWADISPEKPDSANNNAGGYGGIDVDAQHPDTVLVASANRYHSGGDELFRSTDAGGTWRAIGHHARRDGSLSPWLHHADGTYGTGHWMYALAIDPFDSDKAYYGTGQTIWGSTDLTATDRGEPSHWVVSARGIEETVPLALVSPPGDVQLIAGTGDISGFTVFDPADNTKSIRLLGPTFKDTSGIDFAQQDPTLVVRVGSPGWNRETDPHTGAFSTDGGRSWQPFASYPPGDRADKVAVSADGVSWVLSKWKQPAYLSRDQGATWRLVPQVDALVIADRVDPTLFYAASPSWTDRPVSLRVSHDGGEIFGQPAPDAPKTAQALITVFGRRGHAWFVSDGLLHMTPDAGESFVHFDALHDVTHLAVGKAAPHADYPTLFAAAKQAGRQGFYRSTDRGRSWVRINDDAHQFGQVRVLCGDPDTFGRLYIGTGGRGVLYGDPMR